MENAPNDEVKAALQEDYEANAVKLKEAEKQLRMFCIQTGRRRDTFREQVDGFGRSASQKAVHAAKRKKQQKQQAGTAASGTSGHAVEVTPPEPKTNGGKGKLYKDERM